MTGIGALKGVKVAICGIKCIDLTLKAIEILGVFVSCDKNLLLENNFRKTILNIERTLKMRRQRNLTMEDKTLAVSKITFLTKVFFWATKRFFMEFIFSESET